MTPFCKVRLIVVRTRVIIDAVIAVIITVIPVRITIRLKSTSFAFVPLFRHSVTKGWGRITTANGDSF